MDIRKLKLALNQFDYVNPKLDVTNDSFGNKTIAAVKSFQSRNGLAPDGKAGARTLAKLFPDDIHGAVADSALKPFPDNCSSTLAECAMNIAISQNGVRELTGKNDGKAVELYLASVGLTKGYSWCMAFVFWAYEIAAADLHMKNPLLRTGGVLRQWNESGLHKSKTPTVGSILIMDFGGGFGHTGIVTKVGDGWIETVEGNSNTNGSSNGNGVYYPQRRSLDNKRIKGFLSV